MKVLNIFLLLLISQLAYGQDNCQNNLITNTGFENAQPDPGDNRKVIPLNGWTNLNSGSTTVDYFIENEALQQDWLPQPPSGNYLALWIANNENIPSNYNSNPQSRRREGAINQLLSVIPINSGTYSISFDYCCLNTCKDDGGINGIDMPEIGIYGINNPTNNPPQSILGSHVPLNTNLYPNGSTTELALIKLNQECGNELHVINNPNMQFRGTKYHYQATFNMNSISHNITHILITHSDAIIINGNAFVGIDNICITSKENQEISNCCNCCSSLQKENEELAAQLDKCCRTNPKCCKKPKPRPSPKPGVLTPIRPTTNGSLNIDKCCKCCKEMENQNDELKSQIKKCCKSKPDPGVLIPIKGKSKSTKKTTP